jgi:hypothetical protein
MKAKKRQRIANFLEMITVNLHSDSRPMDPYVQEHRMEQITELTLLLKAYR